MSAKNPRPAPARRTVWPRMLLGALLLGAVVVALHALAWRWLGGQMEDGLRGWARSQRAAGWHVSYDPPRRGGWPFSVSLEVPQFRVQGPASFAEGELEWAVPELVLRVAPPLIDRLIAEPRGAQRLRLGEVEIPYAADRLEFVVPFEPGAAVRQIDIVAERLRAGTPEGPAELREFQAHIETRGSATEAEAALAMTLSASGFDLPTGLLRLPAVAALGRRVDAVSADLSVSGPILFSDSLAARAEAWREGGGTLELRDAGLRWGAAEGALRMTLTLDDTMQPMGAGQVQLAGAGDVLRALVAAGAIAPRVGTAAQAAAALLARPPEGGGPPRIDLPVTLEDRRLGVGPIRLLRFAPVTWPTGAESPADSVDPSLPALR